MTTKPKESEEFFPSDPAKPTAVAKADDKQESEPTQPKLEQNLLALAQTPDERFEAYRMASHVRQQQMVAAASKELAVTAWGKEISAYARAAVVRYMLEIGADPMRHCFVLGGNIYLNAEFYRELVAANPKFLRDEVDFIHDDPRASDEERTRRKDQRILFGVPENAPGAAVVVLHYEGRGPFIGVNWAGVRDKDPVGKAEPTKSAQTRAYRKAALKAEPAWFKRHPALREAEEVIAQGRVVPEINRVQLPPGHPTDDDVADRARLESDA
jgi:hypothetical protein